MSAFATMRWTMVLSAAERDASAQEALEELCRVYWPPLYARARREGLTVHDAEDAVQGFFARLLRLDSLATVEPSAGRFRSFLLSSFKHFLADKRAQARAAKRDVRKLINVDVTEVENTLSLQSDSRSPDAVFDQEWAKLLLGRVLCQLSAEQAALGKGDAFQKLAPCLAGRSAEQAHADVARNLKMSEAALRVNLHRLRLRYRVLLRAEIAQTIIGAEEIDDEIRHLMNALS